LAINSADDERNPPELGLLDHEIKRVKNGHVRAGEILEAGPGGAAAKRAAQREVGG
jgi:hypothetical protein